jgi:fumarate hydratase class II
MVFPMAKRGRKATARIEHDSMGGLEVPAGALWGAQTERARRNFQLSERRMPRAFLRALGLLKAAAARANEELGHLPRSLARPIEKAALEVAAGEHGAHFPVDVFQTGSGTSTNMNANEVIARLASVGRTQPVHPNDHVNFGQSSNDVIPSTLLIAASLGVTEELLPALVHLRTVIDRRSRELANTVKTGRTHLMDAVPLTFGQELSAWSAQVRDIEERLREGGARLRRLPIGGTAVGTGLNADPDFAGRVIVHLRDKTSIRFEVAKNRFAGLASPDAAGELGSTLQGLAAVLLKLANDLRLMNSGPLAGFGDIELPTLQPGSSIMPGKVNPVIPEAVAMAAVDILGSVQSIAIACASGSFQLNVMLPLIADRLLGSVSLASRAARALADQAILGFTVREAHVLSQLEKNPILVTALNPLIGYEKGALVAKKAYAEGRPILDVAREQTDLREAELRRLLDPRALTKGGLVGRAPAKKSRR